MSNFVLVIKNCLISAIIVMYLSVFLNNKFSSFIDSALFKQLAEWASMRPIKTLLRQSMLSLCLELGFVFEVDVQCTTSASSIYKISKFLLLQNRYFLLLFERRNAVECYSLLLPQLRNLHLPKKSSRSLFPGVLYGG